MDTNAIPRAASQSSAPHVSRGRRPRVMLMADVPNWIFARHCRVLTELLGDEFDFDVRFQGQSYDERDYDLLYPLEWNLIPTAQIRTPAKYVTGIRSVVSWQSHDFFAFSHYLARSFQRIHCVSQRLTAMFAPLVPNTHYVSHGIDTAFFTPHTRADRSGAGQLRIGWAGNRVNRSKGFEDLVAPLGKIPGVQIVHCGYLDQHLDAEGMKWFYDSIDCYVCSSLHEGNNNSLMEAAAMQRAIITTDNGAVPEYLLHGEHALVVERELPHFVHAVLELRDDPARRVAMGERARTSVVSHFDWPDMARKYATFLHEGLEHASRWKQPTDPLQQALRPRPKSAGTLSRKVAIDAKAVLALPAGEAEATLAEALAHAPDDLSALNTMSVLLFREQRWADCAEYCRRLLILDGSQGQVVARLAESLYASGDTARAGKAFDEAVRLLPGDAELAQRAQEVKSGQALTPAQEAAVRDGAAAIEVSDLAGALAHYRRARDAGPAHPTIDFIIAELEKVLGS